MADVETPDSQQPAGECDPELDSCKEFKNTIELDYRTPNILVGSVGFVQAWLWLILWYAWRRPTTATQELYFTENVWYKFAWEWT